MAEHIQIADVAPRIQYTGNGAQTQFTYPFPIFAVADMEVYLDQAKQTTGFTINGAGDSAGGDVTFDVAPASGVLVTLRRRLAIGRTSDFQESGEFRSKVINDELDYLTAALQQVSDDGKRTLRLMATDPTVALSLPEKVARANLFLAFDAEGDAIASDASGPPGPQGPAGNMDGSNNLSELTDPVTARSNLGLGAAAVETVAASGVGGLLRADGDGSALTGIVVTDDVARANIMLNAFRIAVQGGLSVQNMVDGVVDEFEDETGVDMATSINKTFNAGGHYYTNNSISPQYTNAGGTGDRTASITVVTDCAITGGTINNFVNGGFAGSGTDGIDFTSQAVVGKYFKFDFGPGTGKVITEAKYYQTGANTQGIWKFQGSDTDADWTDIGDSFTLDNSNPQIITTLAGNATGYRYYRLLGVSGNLDGTVWLTEFEFKIDDLGAVQNLTLVSNASAAPAQPDEAFVAVWQQDVDLVMLNIDLKAYASRDGGTTWTQITLAEEADLGASGRILIGSTDISAQPAGTSMKWKLQTFNAKEMKIHGVGLEWS